MKQNTKRSSDFTRLILPLAFVFLLAVLAMGTGRTYARYRAESVAALGFTMSQPTELELLQDTWISADNKVKNQITVYNPGTETASFFLRTLVSEGIGEADAIQVKLDLGVGDPVEGTAEAISAGSPDSEIYPSGWRFRYQEEGEELILAVPAEGSLSFTVVMEKTDPESKLTVASFVRTVILPLQSG